MKNIKLEFYITGDWAKGIDAAERIIERIEMDAAQKYGSREPEVEMKFSQDVSSQ